ncbi:MAG: response regulator transcription factor [Devosia sp.]|uniref:LuxR C-terminal-related transcriptional regulator n=1 Tax=Devosia sp. TaxID=1871048 RepID=UPI0033957990
MRQLRSTALVADSQELFGHSLATVLEQRVGFAKVLTTTHFVEAMRHLLSSSAISLAIFDLQLPDMDSFSSVSNLRLSHPDLRIVISGGSHHRDDILRALSVGAHGYIPRSLSMFETIQALASITAGQIYVPPTVSDLLEDKLFDQTVNSTGTPVPPPSAVEQLTARQYEVMMLIAEGRSNKGIAQKLHLSEGTVKTHVNALFRTLNVHDRTAVATIAATLQNRA